jgi:hypothetical protein
LKSVSAIWYISFDAIRGVTWATGPIERRAPGREEDRLMTIEIFYLTAQIHRWLNARVARYIAAQAAKLNH